MVVVSDEKSLRKKILTEKNGIIFYLQITQKRAMRKDMKMTCVLGKKRKMKIGNTIMLGSAALLLGLTATESSAWSPGGGEEKEYFDRYVYESLRFRPQTPIKNWRGHITGWRGPTLQQQLAAESRRQMGNARNDANAVNRRNAANLRTATTNAVDGASRSINDMKASIRVVGEGTNARASINDPRLLGLGNSQTAAANNVARAYNMVPDGPPATETARLSDRRTAGGQLDRNRDGVISKVEREAALRNRTSMKSQSFTNPKNGIQERKLDANRNGTIEDYGGPGSGGEWQVSLQNVAGTSMLDHNGMIAQRKVNDPTYTTPDVNESSTYTDSRGNVGTVASLNNQANFATTFNNQVTARRQEQARRPIPTTANDLLASASTRGVGSGRVPTTVTSSSRITTGGTWGRTYTDSKTYNVAQDSATSQGSTATRLNGSTTSGAGERVSQIERLESNVRGSLNY